jgi:SAM-dependent methyltransferase
VTTRPIRPSRVDVTASYDYGADAYETLWSPVILPPAAELVPFLALSDRSVVVDVGAGTGALAGAIRSAAPAARVAAVDFSAGMLRFARARRGATAVRADAHSLPLADGTADAVVLAYVLFHLADPARAVREAARVLRPGGRAGTITWAWEREPRAAHVLDQVLADVGAPPAPPRRADAGLDRIVDVAALLSSAGLEPERIWRTQLRRQWDSESYWNLVSGSGLPRIRLGFFDAKARAAALARAEASLGGLAPRDYLWEGEVICAVAGKGA